MEKTIGIWIGIIALIVLVIGGYFVYSATRTDKNLGKNNVDCSLYGPVVKMNVEECSGLSDEELNGCVIKEAIAKKDPKICGGAGNDFAKEGCLVAYAVETENRELCFCLNETWAQMQIPAPLWCIGGIAKKTGDREFCDEFKDTKISKAYEKSYLDILLGICKARGIGVGLEAGFRFAEAGAKENLADCDYVTAGNKDVCYLGVAKNLNDPSICEKISSGNIKTSCEKQF